MKYVDPVITERYARALFAAAKRAQLVDAVLADIETLAPLLGLYSKLQIFFDSPQISTEAKRSLLNKAIVPFVAPVTARLFHLLLDKGRTEYAVAILQRVKKLVREDRGVFEASVTSAVALGDGERARLRATLEEYMRARLEIQFFVDPRVVGGVRFQCGDLLVDDTIRGKLDRLKSMLEAVVTR